MKKLKIKLGAIIMVTVMAFGGMEISAAETSSASPGEWDLVCYYSNGTARTFRANNRVRHAINYWRCIAGGGSTDPN